MTTARDIRLFGVVMLVTTVIAFWFNLSLVSAGYVEVPIVAVFGLLVGVGAYCVGEVSAQ